MLIEMVKSAAENGSNNMGNKTYNENIFDSYFLIKQAFTFISCRMSL